MLARGVVEVAKAAQDRRRARGGTRRGEYDGRCGDREDAPGRVGAGGQRARLRPVGRNSPGVTAAPNS